MKRTVETAKWSVSGQRQSKHEITQEKLEAYAVKRYNTSLTCSMISMIRAEILCALNYNKARVFVGLIEETNEQFSTNVYGSDGKLLGTCSFTKI